MELESRWFGPRGILIRIRCELGSRKEQSIQSTGLGILVRVRIDTRKAKEMMRRKRGAVESVSAEEAGGNPYSAARGVEIESRMVMLKLPESINRRVVAVLTTELT